LNCGDSSEVGVKKRRPNPTKSQLHGKKAAVATSEHRTTQGPFGHLKREKMKRNRSSLLDCDTTGRVRALEKESNREPSMG